MANKILKTLTLPNAQGEPVTYELHPEWDNIEGKPENFGPKGNGIFYIEGTGNDENWYGTHEDITEYYPGLTIAYKIPALGGTGIDSPLLNINNLGNIWIYRNEYVIEDSYPVGSVVILIYTITDDGQGRWVVCDKDTKNTTGTEDATGTKLYLAGGRYQNSYGTTTYSNSNVYIGTDNCLYSNGKKVMTDVAFKSITTDNGYVSASIEPGLELYGGTGIKTRIQSSAADSIIYIDVDVDNLALITVDDIDEICGASIVAASEVTF